MLDSILGPWDCTFHESQNDASLALLDDDVTVPCSLDNDKYLEMFLLSTVGFVFYILLPFLYILRYGYGIHFVKVYKKRID